MKKLSRFLRSHEFQVAWVGMMSGGHAKEGEVIYINLPLAVVIVVLTEFFKERDVQNVNEAVSAELSKMTPKQVIKIFNWVINDEKPKEDIGF